MDYCYDVFLSFRGVDTRKTFTEHLYKALDHAGFRTFTDDDGIERGENIGSKMQKAIQESRMSIVVLSKNYVSSRWCLEELLMILRRRRTSGHVVLPVFYDVDPSLARKQSGCIGEAFTRHEGRVEAESGERRKELMSKLEQWRAALREVADLAGMNLQNHADGHESRFIQKIIKVVGDKLSRTMLDITPYAIGIPSRAREIQFWLEDGSGDVGVAAICGMGGIGKTTLAKSLYNLNFSRFEGSSFLANVRETSKRQDGLLCLQRRLLSDILKGRKEKVYNVDEGIFKIKEALSFKRVLVVLDDVDKLDQLDAVIGMRDSLCPGSKIIITTRREPLLRDHEDCNVHMIEKLNYDESFELFSLHAFGRSHPSDEYVDYSKSVVRHSGGLPLAIKVLGSSLSGKSLELWKSQLEKLKAIPDSKILDKLKISYDSLQDNRAYQSGLLVSNSEKTNAREPSEGVCTTEGVLSLVDSTRRISSTDCDAPGNSAHHVRANQSGPIMLNSEKKDTREGLIGECLTESVLSLDDLTKRKWFPVFGATEIKAHLVSAYQSGPVVSLSENQNRGEALKRECITKSILGLEDLQQHCGGRHDDDAKSYCAIYDPGIHMPDSVARKSFEVLETLTARKQPNGGVPLLLPGRLTLEGCVQQEKSPDLPRVMQFNGVEQRVTKMPRYLGGLTALSASSSCGLIGLPDGGHIVLLDALDQSTKNIKHVATADQCSPTQSLTEKKMVRKTLNRNCRTMSVIFEEKHQRLVRRCEGATKSLGAMCMSRKHGINQVSMVELIHKQRGIHQWPFLQSAVGLPDGGHILSLLEKKIVRKTLRRKCRSTSVLSLEDHKQHVDRRWEDAAKGHGTKRISRQLVIHRLSTAKRTHKQHGIHQWPFQRSTIGLPDGGYIIPLSEKKIVRKTLKRKCRSMSVLSLVDHQQHVDRRWEDAAKNIGAKRICRQLVIHRVSIAKRICRQHGIRHRWPFERDWTTKKGYSVGDERPVVVICLSTHAELVSRLQLIDISWLGRFSPRPSALPRGGLIVGPIALSSSEFADTNNLAQRVRQDQRGSGASGSENERTREQIDPRQDQRGSGPSGSDNERTRNQKDPKKIHTSITEADLLQLQGRMTKKAAAVILGVSESTVKRKWKECNMGEWDNGGGRRRVWKPPDQHGEGNTSTAREMPSHNVQTGVEGEPLGQNQEANECLRDFMGRQIALNPGSGLITVSRPPDQHGEGNTSTAREMPSHNVQTGIEGVLVGQNQEANEFRPDFTEGSIHFNTGNGFIIDSSFGWASQVNDQSILSTPYPNHDAFGFPPPQTTSLPSENMGGSIDLWNPLASHVVSDGHISGSTNSTFATCSVQAGPSQHVQGQSMHPTVYPDHNVFSQTQIVSSQEPFSEGYVFGFGNGNEHTNFVMIKAFYRDGDNTIFKFPFPVTSGIVDLKKEVSKRLNVEVDRFVVKYKDKSEDLISILCNDDLMLCLLSSLGNDEINVLVLDKVGGTPNFCEKCRSSMQTRA